MQTLRALAFFAVLLLSGFSAVAQKARSRPSSPTSAPTASTTAPATNVVGVWDGRIQPKAGLPIPEKGLVFRITLERRKGVLQGTFKILGNKTTVGQPSWKDDKLTGRVSIKGFAGKFELNRVKDRWTGKFRTLIFSLDATAKRVEAGSAALELDTAAKGASFTDSYIAKQRGQATVEIPEVFELVNVAYALTEHGRTHPWMCDRESDYYRKVLKRFEDYRNHPLILKLNRKVGENYHYYFKERDNAFCFRFEGDAIQANNYRNLRGLLTIADDRKLWEDFAKASDFRKFYRSKQAVYQTKIAEVRQYVPIKAMWSWLETHLPGNPYDSYRIVFSPLIGGSHSTVRVTDRGFRECVMFVSDATPPKALESAAAKEDWEARYSRIVFTEIVHNYVNPISSQHAVAIDKAMHDWKAWNAQKQGYENPTLTFNEYMTWAVFSLWLEDRYAPERVASARRGIASFMSEYRGFRHYAAFDDELWTLYLKRKDRDITKLFVPILDWVADFNLDRK